jgi:uncharacterized protein HemY
VASDFGSLGYGEGYAFAQDYACTLADVALRARGERARYFGRGEQDTHPASDVVARAFATEEEARRTLDALPPELRELVLRQAESLHYLGRRQELVWVVGHAQRILGRLAHARGDFHEANSRLDEALQTARSPRSPYETALFHLDLAAVAHAQGEQEAARVHLDEAQVLFKAARVPRWVERTE